MDRKYLKIGLIIFASGMILFFGSYLLIQESVSQGMVSRDNIETYWIAVAILHFSGVPVTTISIPFLIRGFWGNNTALIVMLPFFALLAILGTHFYVIIRSVGGPMF